ncbi:hypothetical protein MMC07_004956 [Pseudocyphellaria aurata]|nr:hypothetical protein [Pseudocyphellaria aurata]
MDATYSTHTRRSHPSLQHFSLAPLTPSTALHSPQQSLSTSYISPHPLPPLSPSILSPPATGPRTRLRSSVSHPIPTSYSTPVFSRPSRLPHHQNPSQGIPSKKSIVKPHAKSDDDGHDWFLRTASALTTSSLEQKGYTWLATRSSSTSLTTPTNPSAVPTSLDNGLADDEYDANSSPEWSRSVAASRFASPVRGRSRMGSRMNSRLHSRRGSHGAEDLRDERKNGAVESDFLVYEDEEDQSEGAHGAEGGEVDEGEMRKIVMGRVGGWVDWAVGWMDFRAEGDDEGDADEGPLEDDQEVTSAPKSPEKQYTAPAPDEIGAKLGKELFVDAPPPPIPLAGDGVWTDTKWLLGVASKIVL